MQEGGGLLPPGLIRSAIPMSNLVVLMRSLEMFFSMIHPGLITGPADDPPGIATSAQAGRRGPE